MQVLLSNRAISIALSIPKLAVTFVIIFSCALLYDFYRKTEQKVFEIKHLFKMGKTYF